MRDALFRRWEKRWNKKPCRQTKIFFPKIIPPFSKRVLQLSRQEYSFAIQFFTGHCWMRRHQALLGELDEDSSRNCRICEESDEEETPEHLTMRCLNSDLLDWRMTGLDQNTRYCGKTILDYEEVSKLTETKAGQRHLLLLVRSLQTRFVDIPLREGVPPIANLPGGAVGAQEYTS